MWGVDGLNPRGDFESIVDGQEEVSYYRYLPATDAYDTVFTVNALCRELGEINVNLASGESTSIDLAVHIAKASIEAQNFLPRRLDKIVRQENRGEDGDEISVSYIVQQVRWSTLGTRYRLECSRALSS